MIKNKSKIVSRFRAGLASLCLVSSTLTVPYANAAVYVDTEIISDGTWVGVREGKLVGCYESVDCYVIPLQADEVKEVYSSYNGDFSEPDGLRGVIILLNDGSLYLQQFPSLDNKRVWGSLERLIPEVKVKTLEVVRYNTASHIYVVDYSGRVGLINKNKDFAWMDTDPVYSKVRDVISIDTYPDELTLALSASRDKIYTWSDMSLGYDKKVRPNISNDALGEGFVDTLVREIKLPFKVVDFSYYKVSGLDKAFMLHYMAAIDENGFLFRAPLTYHKEDIIPDEYKDRVYHEDALGSWELGEFERVFPDQRFTSVENALVLNNSGKLYNLGFLDTLAGYFSKPAKQSNPEVFTSLYYTTPSSVFTDNSGVARVFAPEAAGKDYCLNSFEAYYYYSKDCLYPREAENKLSVVYAGHTWKHPSVIVPSKPSVREKCGELPTVIVPPDTDKVRYERTQEGNKVTVNAYPKPGYVMTSQSSWSYTLTPSAPCPVVSATASPTPTPTVTPTVEVPAPTTSTKPSVFPMTTVTAPPATTTSLPPIPLHTEALTTSKPSATKHSVPVETVVASTSTPVVTKPALEPTPIAEPAPTLEPTGFQFKPWYFLAGLAPLVALPALLPKSVPNAAPVITPPATPSPTSTVSSLSPTTSVSPTTVSQSKAKGIVSGVTAYENRGWLVLVGVLLIAVCSALFVSRRQEGKK